jgi:hypothetical protein
MKTESEKRYLICALQASLLENHKVLYQNNINRKKCNDISLQNTELKYLDSMLYFH